MHYPLYPKRTTINLDGIWDFRLDQRKLIEDITQDDFHFDDLMSVPGCFDSNNKYKHLRGTAIYRTRFRLEETHRTRFSNLTASDSNAVFGLTAIQ